jgi:hypothetical protein
MWPFKVKNWSTIAGTIHSSMIALIKPSFGSDGILNSSRGSKHRSGATVRSAPLTRVRGILRFRRSLASDGKFRLYNYEP